MHRVLCLTTLALACTPVAAEKPRLTISTPRIAVQAATITVSHTVRLAADDGGGPVDSLIVTESGSGQPTQTKRLVAQATQVVSFIWTKPAIGQTITGTITAQVKRRALVSATASRTWSFTTPDQAPPPPIIDTALVISRLDLKPDSVRLGTGQQVQFCAFIAFKDGAVAMRGQDGPVCSAAYTALIPKFPSGAQQAKADSLCLTWQATGGTITVSPCDVVGQLGLRRTMRVSEL